MARSSRAQGQQLPTESQVFEDEVLAGTASVEHPAEEMSERHNHTGILSEKYKSSLAPSHLFCGCTRFWRGTQTCNPSVNTVIRDAERFVRLFAEHYFRFLSSSVYQTT